MALHDKKGSEFIFYPDCYRGKFGYIEYTHFQSVVDCHVCMCPKPPAICDPEKSLVSTILNYRYNVDLNIDRARSVVFLQDNQILRVYSDKRKRIKTKTIKTIAPKIRVETKKYVVSGSLNYDE